MNIIMMSLMPHVNIRSKRTGQENFSVEEDIRQLTKTDQHAVGKNVMPTNHKKHATLLTDDGQRHGQKEGAEHHYTTRHEAPKLVLGDLVTVSSYRSVQRAQTTNMTL